MAGFSKVCVDDGARMPGWLEKGTIPRSINIPWTKLAPEKGASFFEIASILQRQFSVVDKEGLWSFFKAKSMVLFCNGMWCGQSPRNIAQLLEIGYPAEKIKWYRGGMQNWEALGLTTVKPK
jgi:3-mercaptopyruvate sulfurtransferase SseA